MRKTLIALIALAGVAAAASTTLTDLNATITAEDGYGYLYSKDASTGIGTFTDDPSVEGNLLCYFARSGKVQTNVTFTFDLTEAATAVGQGGTAISLVNLDLNGYDIGLYLTHTGIGFGYAYDHLEETVLLYTSLGGNSSSFVGNDGHRYITLTCVQYQDGIKIYDNTEALLSNGYAFSTNTALDNITVNTNYVEGVQINNVWGESVDYNKNSAFDETMRAQLLPEPTTATLSLLALAGLAARRRRR